MADSSPHTAHRSSLTAHRSSLTAHRSRLIAPGSPHPAHRTRHTARRTRLTAPGSPHRAHGTGLTAHGSSLTARLLVARRTRLITSPRRYDMEVGAQVHQTEEVEKPAVIGNEVADEKELE